MKKLIAMILAIVLALAAVPASAKNHDLIGTWVFTSWCSSGASVEVLILAEDGVLYYVSQAFIEGELYYGKQVIGKWGVLFDKVWFAYEGYEDTCTLSDDGMALLSKEQPGLAYVKLGRWPQ